MLPWDYGEGKIYDGVLPFDALCPYPASVFLDDVLAYCQTQPSASVILRAGFLATVEALKYMGKVFGRNALSIIFDKNFKESPWNPGAYYDLPIVWYISPGVFDYVVYDLRYSFAIRFDIYLG